ncbi:MAG: hypothetical protein Q7U98_02145 [Methylicorpusculum sp.]|nr:hypothetical protein [Methylicorpusculum sp.]MDO8937938.1 hypothetical protein [Methylicorpusculum sp.]MDP2201609.1 hypothetical protein [Methylicorpusculum sp.]
MPIFGTGVPVKGSRKYILCRLYASIHAGKAFAEHPDASLGTAEI